ncbi:hypothetical protein L1887_37354 [Cichorium endivia]|nr:hypothetical protein L1887_37354 [Cichorium endivia]
MWSMFIRTLCFLLLIVNQDHYVIRASRVFRKIIQSEMPSTIDESLIFNHHRVHEPVPPRVSPTVYKLRKEASGLVPLPPVLPTPPGYGPFRQAYGRTKSGPVVPAFWSTKEGPSDGRGHQIPPPSS